MKLPAIFRKKRGGKFYGNYLAAVDGQDVNLGSKDPAAARETLKAILLNQAAAASEPDVEDGDAVEAARAGEPAAPVAVPPSPAPVVPDHVLPPAPASSDADARAEADATNQSAAETGGAPQAGPDQAAAGFTLAPEAIEGLLQQAGQAVVLMQLDLQAWIVKKRTGKIAAPIDLTTPMGKMLFEAAAQGWVAQLKIWFPDIELCPPWLVAVGAPLLFLPAQFAGATEDPAAKTPENQAAEPAKVAA